MVLMVWYGIDGLLINLYCGFLYNIQSCHSTLNLLQDVSAVVVFGEIELVLNAFTKIVKCYWNVQRLLAVV